MVAEQVAASKTVVAHTPSNCQKKATEGKKNPNDIWSVSVSEKEVVESLKMALCQWDARQAMLRWMNRGGLT